MQSNLGAKPAMSDGASNPQILLSMVSDIYLNRIGKVVTQWSMMEAVLEGAIWQAASLRNDIGRAMTSQTQVQGKLDLLASILMQTRPALGEQVILIARCVRECLLGDAIRRSIIKALPKGLRDLAEPVERALAQVRACVEYPFPIVKNPGLRRGRLCTATRSCALAAWPRIPRNCTLCWPWPTR